MSMMVSFVLSFFPRDVLDEILNLIESVSEDFPSYSIVNQFIYTLVRTYMPNIRILAKAVIKIFCSQGCSYTKCLCPKKENNSSEK